MTRDAAEASAGQPADMTGDRTKAWWSQVLAGQTAQTHPTWGSDLKFKVRGDELLVTGTLANDEDLAELTREVDAMKGNGISDYTIDVVVSPPETAQEGLLEQTLVGVYETADQARFAVSFIESSYHVTPTRMRVIEPAEVGDAATRSIVPDEYWDDVEKALGEGHALLVLTVDEVKAFRAREALDEETRSLATFILPPQPTGSHAAGTDSAVAARPGQAPRDPD